MFHHQAKVESAGIGRTIFRELYLSRPNVHLKIYLLMIRTWTETWVNKNQRMKNRYCNGNDETDIFVSVAIVHIHAMINRGIETEMLPDHEILNVLLGN